MQSHLNCAVLSHEYAVKYNSVCRDLHHIAPLTKVKLIPNCNSVLCVAWEMAGEFEVDR